jgi:hypothetical protein
LGSVHINKRQAEAVEKLLSKAPTNAVYVMEERWMAHGYQLYIYNADRADNEYHVTKTGTITRHATA